MNEQWYTNLVIIYLLFLYIYFYWDNITIPICRTLIISHIKKKMLSPSVGKEMFRPSIPTFGKACFVARNNKRDAGRRALSEVVHTTESQIERSGTSYIKHQWDGSRNTEHTVWEYRFRDSAEASHSFGAKTIKFGTCLHALDWMSYSTEHERNKEALEDQVSETKAIIAYLSVHGTQMNT